MICRSLHVVSHTIPHTGVGGGTHPFSTHRGPLPHTLSTPPLRLLLPPTSLSCYWDSARAGKLGAALDAGYTTPHFSATSRPALGPRTAWVGSLAVLSGSCHRLRAAHTSPPLTLCLSGPLYGPVHTDCTFTWYGLLLLSSLHRMLFPLSTIFLYVGFLLKHFCFLRLSLFAHISNHHLSSLL